MDEHLTRSDRAKPAGPDQCCSASGSWRPTESCWHDRGRRTRRRTSWDTRFEGPAPEVAVSNDMIKRGLIVAPIIVASLRSVIWGANGACSSMPTPSPSCWPNFALAAAPHRRRCPNLGRIS